MHLHHKLNFIHKIMLSAQFLFDVRILTLRDSQTLRNLQTLRGSLNPDHFTLEKTRGEDHSAVLFGQHFQSQGSNPSHMLKRRVRSLGLYATCISCNGSQGLQYSPDNLTLANSYVQDNLHHYLVYTTLIVYVKSPLQYACSVHQHKFSVYFQCELSGLNCIHSECQCQCLRFFL